MIHVKELYQQLEQATSVDEKLSIYRRLSFEFLNNDMARCEEVTNELLEFALEHDHAAGKAEAYNALGRFYFRKNEQAKAIEAFETALKQVEHHEHVMLVSQILVAIGMVHFNYGKLDSAEEYYNRSLMLLDLDNDDTLRGGCHNNLGNVKHFKGLYDEAIEHYRYAISLYEKFPHKRGSVANSKGNLAIVLVKQEKLEEAVGILLTCLADFHAIGHKAGEMQTLINIGNTYNMLKDQGEAMAFLQQAQKMLRSHPNMAIETQLYNGFSEVYKALKGYDQALAYLNKAEKLNEQTKRAEQICHTWHLKAKLLREMGKTEQANELYQKVYEVASKNGLQDKLNLLQKESEALK